ncbi:unnamed protein product [Tuber aestivum]|uniref:RGS domain-containing protein n=1 Tax=Tuber aestivum TaxID=59557 RepID=A0A292PK98_9PEZI|nr:unnamed protein product [Tuber aestivum]
MVVGVLLYRRPSFVSSTSPRDSSSSELKGLSLVTSNSSHPSRISGIPDSLSFDKIIAGGTCSPITCRDFMSYLLYVEHAAENLQFYLWLRDYTERFNALSENEKALSPPVPVSPLDPRLGPKSGPGVRPDNIVSKFLSDAFCSSPQQPAVPSPTKPNPFTTPPHTPGIFGDSDYELGNSAIAPFSSIESRGLNKINHRQIAAEAYQSAGMGWQPFSVHPFRDEVTRVVAIYIAEGGPRELNVSSRDRMAALHGIVHTTHPSAFDPLRKTVEDALLYQAHPNFIRWSIRNGNPPRIIFAICLGVGTILTGLMIALLLTLSNLSRGWRAMAAIPWVVGISTLFAAHKGMCVVLHGIHARNIHPWELWADEGSNGESSKESFESQATSNSREDEPWRAKYEKRNPIRKIFEKQVRIKEPALRQIQNAIFLQSMIVAIIASAILCAAFVTLPSGGYLP